MRVAHSLSSAGLGMAVLATFGFAGQSKQPQQKPVQLSVRPTERLVLEPVSASWADLVKADALLPRFALAQVDAVQAIDVPAESIPQLGVDAGVPASYESPMAGTDGSQALALCPSLGAEPLLDHGFLAQADVPDSTLTVYIPPNVAGDVGPSHVMTTMLNAVTIRDRIGGLVSSVDLAAFWSPVLGATLAYPKVSYDALSGRWLASARSGTGGTMNILFAISDTSDPTGTWDFYSIVADAGGTTFPDWIQPGTNATWHTLITNMFNVVGGALAGVKMWVIDMATAVAGGPLTVTVFPTGFNAALTGGATGNSFTPTTSLDTSSPDMWLLNTTFGNTATPSARTLQLINISGTGPAPVAAALAGSPFGGTTSLCFVTTNFSTTQVVVGQVGDPRFITPFSIRVQSAVLRNGKIWVANQGGLPLAPAAQNRTASFWHQLDPTLPFPASPGAPGSMLLQSNVIDGGIAGSGVIYPSLAVNCGDDAVIGYSRSDSTRNPEAGYVVRVGTDPLGAQSPLRLLRSGDSSYWKNFGVGTLAQWGLYSSTGIDPVDDKTFWTLQEYAAQRVGPADNDSRWGTWWGRIGECGEPLITDDPDPVTACLGDPASFSVSATAFLAPMAFQWRKNGVDIPGATGTTFSIGSTTVSDGGLYDVRVIDGCGSVISLSALLDFAGATINTQPANQNVNKGGTANFTVAATGTGTVTYSWRKNGVPIVPAETNPTLTITNVKKSDVGLYDCVVTDNCGPVTSNSALLSVKEKGKLSGNEPQDLQIWKQPESSIICETGTHTLSVTAYGQSLSYVWRKGGVPIVPPETNDTLVLTGIVPGDAGNYDVVVSGVGGSVVSDTAVLTVSAKATITGQPANVGAMLGDNVSFTVTATAPGDIGYQWKRGGTFGPLFNMPGQTDSTLEIFGVGNPDAGRYQCVLTNECGSVNSAIAKLTIIL
jgi:hypothetical protein